MRRHTDTRNPSRRRRWSPRLRLMLAAACMAIPASSCSDSITDPAAPIDFPEEEVIGTAARTATKTLFKGLLEGTLHGAGHQIVGWAFGALGIAAESEDYTEQLDKIDEDLQEVIGQLSEVQDELGVISSELTVLNCSEWATSLTTEKGRIDNLLADYESFVGTAANGGTVSSATLADWADQVLAQGAYASHESMGDIISTFASTLVGPANTGVIPACVQSIPTPDDGEISADDDYYEQVGLFTDYYYNYQVRALFLYVEAKHYEAWLAAGSPVSTTLAADSVSEVCEISTVEVYCNQAAARINAVYNSLIEQLTLAGAPYTNDDFVFINDADEPFLMPLSVEAFTYSYEWPDACGTPLTTFSAGNPCGGIMHGYYNTDNGIANVTHRSYKGWEIADAEKFNILLSGWTSGMPGKFLQSAYGFKNMKNKIIITPTLLKMRLDDTNKDMMVIAFFDTDMDHDWISSLIDTKGEFEKLTLEVIADGGICWGPSIQTYRSYDYKGSPETPDSTFYHTSRRNGFYHFNSHARKCGSNFTTDQHFLSDDLWPGWVASLNGVANPDTSALQLRWPYLDIASYDCTENRSGKNAAGVWSMCANDFTTWLDDYIPRPETCDDSATGVSCVLDAATIAAARATRERTTPEF